MRKIHLMLLLLFTSFNLMAQVKGEFILKNRNTHTDLYMDMGDVAIKWQLNSTEIKSFEKPGFFYYDKEMHQFLVIANSAITSTSMKSAERQKALLLGYMKYETDYIR